MAARESWISYFFSPSKIRILSFRHAWLAFLDVILFILFFSMNPWTLAVIEARDVRSYLKALEPHFEDIKDTGFKDIQMKLKPLLHCVCLLWSNSRYYCTSTRIITLLVEISNLLISEVQETALSNFLLEWHPIIKTREKWQCFHSER